MTDADIIQSAYADALKKLFSVYFEALATAAGDAAAEARAASDFGRGVAIARKARDRAAALVAQGSSG